MPNDRRPIAAAGWKPISRMDEWRKIWDRVDNILVDNPRMKRTTAMRRVALEDLHADGVVLKTESARKTAVAKYLQRVKRAYTRYETAFRRSKT
jgi:hypothetical protein